MLDELLGVGGVVDRLKPEADARFKLSGCALERRQGLVVGAGYAGRVAETPVDCLRRAGKLGADLAHAVAETDHVVKAPSTELVEVFGTSTREVDPALA